jgi:hypothetical protein
VVQALASAPHDAQHKPFTRLTILKAEVVDSALPIKKLHLAGPKLVPAAN